MEEEIFLGRQENVVLWNICLCKDDVLLFTFSAYGTILY